jgi:uncharacterized protein Veg
MWGNFKTENVKLKKNCSRKLTKEKSGMIIITTTTTTIIKRDIFNKIEPMLFKMLAPKFIVVYCIYIREL